jgi:hypothetical protein
MYYVERMPRFDKEVLKHLSFKQQKDLSEFETKLVNNPYVGRFLSYTFFREKKMDDKRTYFLIYEELKTVLLVAISDKKAQQATIDEIKRLLPTLKEYVIQRLKQRGVPFPQQTPSDSQQSGQ